MKVVRTEASSNKTSATIDLSDELSGLNKSQKKELADQIGELLIEQALLSVADAKSPITGTAFTALSKEYAEHKMDEVGNKKPNLDVSGDMLQDLDFKINGDQIDWGVFGSEAPKADGHNNLSGKSKLPERRFIPAKGQTFDESILSLVKDTVDAYKADHLELDETKLKDVETKSELYDYLKEELDGMSEAEIKEFILGSPLSVTLDKFDLLELL